jgi:flagellar basal-body rod protein FlgG
MFQPLYIAATGLNAFEEQMVDVTNNLANARTVAFKRGKTEMESLFYLEKTFQRRLSEEMERVGEKPYAPIEFGTGVRISSTPKDFSQGTIEITSSPYDFAIQGEGFFQFRLPDGSVAYGRAGNLHVDNEGNLVDPNGRMLEPSITVPDRATSVTIQQDGTVLVTIDNELEQVEIGQITLARFANPGGLKAAGQNLFVATPASGEPVIGIANEEGFGYIQQYALESSNVDVISEMMRMVMVQRVFDTVSKAVQAYDGMLATLERIKQ